MVDTSDTTTSAQSMAHPSSTSTAFPARDWTCTCSPVKAWSSRSGYASSQSIGPGAGYQTSSADADYATGPPMSLPWPDSLGIDRFEALGWSGGGPYALACAAMLPGRITAATVVSCVGPQIVTAPVEGINAQSLRFFRLNRDRPMLGRLLDALMLLGARRGPEKFLARTVAALPPTDQGAMGRPDVGRAYIGARARMLSPGDARTAGGRRACGLRVGL
jgi:pimeloyl-ACP methyl ester carboxylesterase